MMLEFFIFPSSEVYTKKVSSVEAWLLVFSIGGGGLP